MGQSSGSAVRYGWNQFAKKQQLATILKLFQRANSIDDTMQAILSVLGLHVTKSSFLVAWQTILQVFNLKLFII